MVGIQLAVLWGIPARLLHPDPSGCISALSPAAAELGLERGAQSH